MDFLLEPGVAIYMALAVALVVWIGLFTFLWRVDRRIREIRRQLGQAPQTEQPPPRATLEARPAALTSEAVGSNGASTQRRQS